MLGKSKAPSIHTPERGADESFEDYRARRRASQAAAQQLKDGTNFIDVKDWERICGGAARSSRDRHRGRVRVQRARLGAAPGPKFPKERKRKPAKAHGPTWPRTEDQKAQSRPLIVIKPIRQIKQMDRSAERLYAKELAAAGSWPKPMLDTAVLLKS
jgi:hypothetical protein